MYVANMNTSNFDFIATGTTEEQAKLAMVQTMRRWRTQAMRNDGQYGRDTWAPYMFTGHSYVGLTDFDAYPDDDLGWLMYLVEDWYCANVSGPYTPGAPGTVDGSEIFLP